MTNRKRKLASNSPEQNITNAVVTVETPQTTITVANAQSPTTLPPTTPPLLPQHHQPSHHHYHHQHASSSSHPPNHRHQPHHQHHHQGNRTEHVFAVPALPSYAPSSSAGTSSTVSKRRRGGNTTTSVNPDGVASSHYCPSVNSSTFRYPSDSTKTALGRRDGWSCWLCGIRRKSRLEVVHHVAANVEIERLDEWKSLYILPSSFHPASINNLMILCSNCHDSYDATYPHWTLLPTDLSLFLSHEISDYESRLSIARQGKQPPPRSFPNTAEAKRYTPYFLADIVNESGISLSDFPKSWLGTPQAIVLKAAMAAFMPVKRTPSVPDKDGRSTSLGLDDGTRNKLLELLRLWTRPDPITAVAMAAAAASPARKVITKTEESETDDEEGKHDGNPNVKKDKDSAAKRKRNLRKRKNDALASPAGQQQQQQQQQNGNTTHHQSVGTKQAAVHVQLTPPTPRRNNKRTAEAVDTPLPKKRRTTAATTSATTHQHPLDPLTPPDTTTPHTSPKRLRKRKSTISPLENATNNNNSNTRAASSNLKHASAAAALVTANEEEEALTDVDEQRRQEEREETNSMIVLDDGFPDSEAYGRGDDGEREAHVWGPEKSANDVMEIMKGWDNVRKEDEKERRKRRRKVQQQKQQHQKQQQPKLKIEAGKVVKRKVRRK